MESEALPRDLIVEVLSRSSLKTLDRSKAVSKDWKRMIYEAAFLPLHSQGSRCVLGYLFQDMRHNKYLSALVMACGCDGDDMNWSSSYDDIKIVAACSQGFLCCEKKINSKNYRYYICKPATNQWQCLPNPKLRYQTVVVAIVVRKSHPLRFTIVRLSKLRPMKYRCEVFDSQTWAWEETTAPIMSESDREHIICWETSVTVGESVYWLTSRGNVLAFNTSSRSFQCLRLPEEVSHHEFKRIGDYEGGLAFTCTDTERKTMDLWVANGDEHWTRKMKVDMGAVRDMVSQYYRPVEFCNSDIVFLTSDNGAALYNAENQSVRKLDISLNLRDTKQIFRFRSDFEMVDFRYNYDLSLSTNSSSVTVARTTTTRRCRRGEG